MTRPNAKDELISRLCAIGGGPALRPFLELNTVEQLRHELTEAEKAAELVRKYGRAGAEARDEAW